MVISSQVINHLATTTKHQAMDTVSQLPPIIIKLLQAMATVNQLPPITNLLIASLLPATDLLAMALRLLATDLPLIMVLLATRILMGKLKCTF